MGIFSKSKTQKLLFRCSLLIHSFERVPLADDFVFLKVKPPRKVSKPSVTARAPIRYNTATFDTEFTWDIPLVMDTSTFLLDSFIIRVSVRHPQKRGSHDRLGYTEIDLAGFAGESGCTAIFPLKECRFAGELRCSISMSQLNGDATYKVPPHNAIIQEATTSRANELDTSHKPQATCISLQSPLTPLALPVDSPPTEGVSLLKNHDIVDDLFMSSLSNSAET
ncbi:hypothetical protein P9112_007696 [Eukaryota sp. TZLM1-RC]